MPSKEIGTKTSVNGKFSRPWINRTGSHNLIKLVATDKKQTQTTGEEMSDGENFLCILYKSPSLSFPLTPLKFIEKYQLVGYIHQYIYIYIYYTLPIRMALLDIFDFCF